MLKIFYNSDETILGVHETAVIYESLQIINIDNKQVRKPVVSSQNFIEISIKTCVLIYENDDWKENQKMI